jgi:hypothetical protein
MPTRLRLEVERFLTGGRKRPQHHGGTQPGPVSATVRDTDAPACTMDDEARALAASRGVRQPESALDGRRLASRRFASGVRSSLVFWLFCAGRVLIEELRSSAVSVDDPNRGLTLLEPLACVGAPTLDLATRQHHALRKTREPRHGASDGHSPRHEG